MLMLVIWKWIYCDEYSVFGDEIKLKWILKISWMVGRMMNCLGNEILSFNGCIIVVM